MTSPRVALYVRTSHADRTIENQVLELERVANSRGWTIVQTFSDEGISGAKGRDKRPGFDKLLKGAVRRDFDMIAVWSLDRLGRSVSDLLDVLQTLNGAGCALYSHRQALDTTSPAGRAMFAMLGVFAEFEREMIRERVLAGIARRRKQGKPVGKQVDPERKEKLPRVRELLASGVGVTEIARETGVSRAAIYREKHKMSENIPDFLS